MATLKQRLHRKNASGTYDTVHFESSSDLILRPSGRTVEQDLADYLPEVQANDNVPESLNKFVCGSTKAFAKRRALAFEGTVNTQINDLRDDLERQIAEVAAGGDVDLSDYYTKSETNNLLDDKSDIGHTHSQYVTSSTSSLYYYYTKTQVDQIESELRAAIDEAAAGGDVDLSNYYTKYQTDNLLNQKAALNHSHAISDITNLQSTLNGKASISHTHSQYLTETAVNALIQQKLSDYYTKREVDALIDASTPTYRWYKYYPYSQTVQNNVSISIHDFDKDEQRDGWLSDRPFPVDVSSASNVKFNTSVGGSFNFEDFGGNEEYNATQVLNKYLVQDGGSHNTRQMFYLRSFVPNSVSTISFKGDIYQLDRNRQQGQFIEEVTSPDPAAYPNSGYDKNTGYWYVKQS